MRPLNFSIVGIPFSGMKNIPSDTTGVWIANQRTLAAAHALSISDVDSPSRRQFLFPTQCIRSSWRLQCCGFTPGPPLPPRPLVKLSSNRYAALPYVSVIHEPVARHGSSPRSFARNHIGNHCHDMQTRPCHSAVGSARKMNQPWGTMARPLCHCNRRFKTDLFESPRSADSPH